MGYMKYFSGGCYQHLISRSSALGSTLSALAASASAPALRADNARLLRCRAASWRCLPASTVCHSCRECLAMVSRTSMMFSSASECPHQGHLCLRRLGWLRRSRRQHISSVLPMGRGSSWLSGLPTALFGLLCCLPCPHAHD